MQRRRVHTNTAAGGSSFSLNTIGTITETNGVNAHGLRASFVCEPENVDANATGNWVLYCIPDEAFAVPVSSTTVLELEASNAFIWALGTWAASNQTPYCKDIEIGTSRNCQNGARIVLVVDVEGVSAGNVSVRTTLTYFTTSTQKVDQLK